MKIFAWIFLSFIFATSTVSQDAGKPPVPQPSARKPIESLSLSEMKLLKYEELPTYGIFPPKYANHAKGRALILLTLIGAANVYPSWVVAHGMLGTTMLDCDDHDRVAYESLFLSRFHGSGHKLAEAGNWPNSVLLVDEQFSKVGPYNIPRTRDSFIFRRESIISSAAKNIKWRFVYEQGGRFGRSYAPSPNRASIVGLKADLQAGLDLYSELKKKGYEDTTLRDVLGIVHAVLEFDEFVDLQTQGILGVPIQLYRDSLKSTLESVTANPWLSYKFLFHLGEEMRIRGLVTEDRIVLPESESNHTVILRLIDEDLALIQRTKKGERKLR